MGGKKRRFGGKVIAVVTQKFGLAELLLNLCFQDHHRSKGID